MAARLITAAVALFLLAPPPRAPALLRQPGTDHLEIRSTVPALAAKVRLVLEGKGIAVGARAPGGAVDLGPDSSTLTTPAFINVDAQPASIVLTSEAGQPPIVAELRGRGGHGGTRAMGRRITIRRDSVNGPLRVIADHIRYEQGK